MPSAVTTSPAATTPRHAEALTPEPCPDEPILAERYTQTSNHDKEPPLEHEHDAKEGSPTTSVVRAHPMPIYRFAAFALVGLVACQSTPKDDPAPAPSAASTKASPPPTASVSSAPPPPPFTGTLTVERVLSAKGVVRGMQPYGAAYGALVGILGAPTKTVSAAHALVGKKQDRYQWAAMSDTACASFFAVQNPDVMGGPGMLSEDSGGGKFEMPNKVRTAGPDASDLAQKWRSYIECVAILGRAPGLPADDPKGAAPGPNVGKTDIDKGLDLAPGKWIGKTVTVRGTYEGISGRTSMILKDSRGDIVSCLVPKGTTPPEQKAPSAKVTVKGKVVDPRAIRETGGDLEECALVP